jgi:antitoxin MazE
VQASKRGNGLAVRAPAMAPLLSLDYNRDVYRMRVAKWGSSLAIRLPAAVVEALELREGDQLQIRVAGKGKLAVARGADREWILKAMERLSRPLPPGFKFKRVEIHERR